MTNYKRLTIRELYQENNNVASGLIKVEVVGKLRQSPDFPFTFFIPTYLERLFDKEESVFIFSSNKFRKILKKSYDDNLPLLVRGTFNINYINVAEAELYVSGELSVADGLEGKISLANTGNLSLK